MDRFTGSCDRTSASGTHSNTLPVPPCRLLSHADGYVTFAAKDYRHGRKPMRVRLAGVEFTRRFALHILPRGMPRVRRFGLLAPRGKKGTRCRELLHASLPTPPPATESAEASEARDDGPRCPQCKIGRLKRNEETPRPRLFALLLKSGFAPRHLLPFLCAPRRDTS